MDNLISIIIPVYNRQDLIVETIESVLAQTHTNWECIIVDDGSKDLTVEQIEMLARKDKRIKLFKRPDELQKGASPCRNYGLKRAKGDYIQFLDSDDLLHETKFEKQLQLLKRSNPMAIASCRWGNFADSSKLKVKTKWNSYGNFKPGVKLLQTYGQYDEYFPPIVFLTPMKVIENAGFWDESIPNNPNDDGEYFSRVILNASKVIFCEDAEVYYRAGDSDRLSLLDSEQKIKSSIASWKMIQRNLHAHKKISRIYTQNGIRNIYKQIKTTYPEIVKDHNDFFQKIISKKKWYQRINWKVNFCL